MKSKVTDFYDIDKYTEHVLKSYLTDIEINIDMKSHWGKHELKDLIESCLCRTEYQLKLFNDITVNSIKT